MRRMSGSDSMDGKMRGDSLSLIRCVVRGSEDYEHRNSYLLISLPEHGPIHYIISLKLDRKVRGKINLR